MYIIRYLNLVPSQNREKPKFISWLSAPLSKADETVLLYEDFTNEFDLDTAIGAQLNIIGILAGVQRQLDFQPSVGSPIVDDVTFRRMIKAKIAKNQWDGTFDGITSIWNQFFPEINLVVSDNQDMTVTILVFGVEPGLERELIQNGYFIPRAQSVSYEFLFADNIAFAFGIDNAFYSGFDVGHWV